MEAITLLTEEKLCFTAQNVWDKVKLKPLDIKDEGLSYNTWKREVHSFIRELWNTHHDVFSGYAVTVSTIQGHPLHFFPLPPQVIARQGRMKKAATQEKVLGPGKITYAEKKKAKARTS
jgi:hypothetical protein